MSATMQSSSNTLALATLGDSTPSPQQDGDLVADRWVRIGEPLALILLIGMALATILVVQAQPTRALLSPLVVTALLIGNLLPALAILAFTGRRIVLRRSRGNERHSARLHTRLVALFSVTAAVPTMIVAMFASFLFQSGMDFWFSERSRGMFESAVSVAQSFLTTERNDVGANTLAMANDLRNQLRRTPLDSDDFYDFYVQQVVIRELSESAIIEVGRDRVPRTLALIDPDNQVAENRLPPATIRQLQQGAELITGEETDGVVAAVRLFEDRPVYLYAARGASVLGFEPLRRARSVFADYNSLFDRSRSLQYRVLAALYIGSLLLVSLAIWAAIIVANRITSPINELVDAAQRVAAGDLEVRVKGPGGRPDEIATLAGAFNVMTERLGEQTRDLVMASDQIETRRAFMETVLSSVASGVVSLDPQGVIRLTNASACSMLEQDAGTLTGAAINDAVPEIAAWLADGASDPVIDIQTGPGAADLKTFALRAIPSNGGYVLTLEDITQQLVDQRRAAWSDVARRVAHEIKNPLTPIQLAAERLQRRFGGDMGEGADTFKRLTSTITRQVNDLRRMVDEFSSFARMPKPVFRPENLVDIAKQAVFLHEVANPDVRFAVTAPDAPQLMVCDRHLLMQAFSNIVKNAVEATQRQSERAPQVSVSVEAIPAGLVVVIADNGIGLPQNRDAIVEPYVTMREGGTGLGLAIVQKIVEEHGGHLAFADNPGGGSVVTVTLLDAPADPAALNAEGAG